MLKQKVNYTNMVRKNNWHSLISLLDYFLRENSRGNSTVVLVSIYNENCTNKTGKGGTQ